jgi:sulfoacetaldehyde dehydrogenase
MEDDIKEMYVKAKKAFDEYQYWSQEKVDEVVQAVGWMWQKEEVRKVLAKTAVDESGIGVYEDKLAKIRTKTLGTLWDQRGVKTCGLVEEDKARGIRKYAKPIGVIADVVPCTNPESTICCIGLSTLKTRNAMIVSPHPRTQKSSYLTVEYGREALKKIGAPVDLLQCIKNTSQAKTQELMAHCDFAVATGGAALVKVVYAAGKPAQTVSAGNVVSFVDETVPDLQATARKILLSKIANNAASCSSENAVALHAGIYDRMIECLKKEGGYLCSTAERETLRKCMWPDGKTLNRDIVAHGAKFIADLAGLKVPENTKFLMVIGDEDRPRRRFSGEKISPCSPSGSGPTSTRCWTDWKRSSTFRARAIRFRSTPSWTSAGEAGAAAQGRPGGLQHGSHRGQQRRLGRRPAFHRHPRRRYLGGQHEQQNVNWRHFLNYTLVSMPIRSTSPATKLFGDYLKKWGRG